MPCNCHLPCVLTPAEWKAKHRDFKSIHRDQTGKIIGRSALRLCPVHGTCCVPVTVLRPTKAPCQSCGRSEGREQSWFTPCPADDCPSHHEEIGLPDPTA